MELIPNESYENLLNCITPYSDLDKTELLVDTIYKHIKTLENNGDTRKAKETIREFGQLVREVDAALESIGTEISKTYIMSVNSYNN